MIKKKSSHFICAWQWLMLSSETMRRKLEIQKLEQVFRFFSFSFIPPLFFKHSPPESGWILLDLFVAAHCRGWLMISYLVRSDFMDSSLVSSGSYIFSWMPNRRFLSHFGLCEETALGLVCYSERLSFSF